MVLHRLRRAAVSVTHATRCCSVLCAQLEGVAADVALRLLRQPVRRCPFERFVCVVRVVTMVETTCYVLGSWPDVVLGDNL